MIKNRYVICVCVQICNVCTNLIHVSTKSYNISFNLFSMGKGKKSSPSISRKALLKRLEKLEKCYHRSRSRSSRSTSRSVSRERRERRRRSCSRYSRASDRDRQDSYRERPSKRRHDLSPSPSLDSQRPRHLNVSRSAERDRVGRSPSVADYSHGNESPQDDVLVVETGEGSILNGGTPRRSNRNSPDIQGGIPELIINNDDLLDTETLKILGEDPKEKKSNNLVLHNALCSRWSHILSHNISEEDRKDLYDRYIIPDNLVNLNPPEVNPEVYPHLSPYHKNRDDGYVALQKQLAHSLTALGTTLNALLNKRDDVPEGLKNSLLGPLWDSGRLQAGLFSRISQIRRTAIVQANNKQFKEIAEKTRPEKLLFGPDLAEKFKEAKALENMGKNLFSASSASNERNKINNSRFSGGKRGGGTGSYSGNRQRPFRQWTETKATKGPHRPLKMTHQQRFNNSSRRTRK